MAFKHDCDYFFFLNSTCAIIIRNSIFSNNNRYSFLQLPFPIQFPYGNNITLQQSETQNGDEQHIVVTKEITSTEGKIGKKKSSIDSDSSSKNGSTKKKSKKSKKSGDSEKENISVVSLYIFHLKYIQTLGFYFIYLYLQYRVDMC